jgi:hypothetical protein
MENQYMEELNIKEINDVSGGGPTAVAYGTGLATSIVIGAGFGPPGIGVAFVGFTASFFGTLLFSRMFNRA